ncbi:Ferrous-iron efflux pump FieF [Anaerohalosphaera lusitana]|uniref:Ferrous-iron efflux pump FieF n=1 Tax=Anaerohalosphaera lusitana TaxID=1936003 RepID=A0A1U9NL61_9BACT|nr:cation diffusion facilitator family transporter [Anaerohalosphaera lusitana]AQT68537.1 Ferrous-iron efflux pump FieF [Anaerohalosphaera lusitana]
MDAHKINSANASIRKVTWGGIWANLGLAIVKVSIGWIGGSLALVADGVHSVSDMVTDFAVLLGAHFGAKEPDPKHPYGHGRLETFSAMFVAIFLALVGAGMIYQASVVINRVHLGHENIEPIGISVMWAAILSVIAKELLYRITRKVARRVHSPALYANAWHHRSDALSSIAVVIGFVAFRAGYEYADQVATIAVGLMIIWVAAKVIRDCLEEFAERAVDGETIKQIEHVVSSDERVKGYHKLRTRNVGREIFLDMHILIDPNMNVEQAHDIADELEADMHEQISRPVNIMVHIEPDIPKFRK